MFIVTAQELDVVRLLLDTGMLGEERERELNTVNTVNTVCLLSVCILVVCTTASRGQTKSSSACTVNNGAWKNIGTDKTETISMGKNHDEKQEGMKARFVSTVNVSVYY